MQKFDLQNAAKDFWAWFEEKEQWVIECIESHNPLFILAIDAQLQKVFPHFEGVLEFQLGYNDGKGEFYFYHLGNKDLERDGRRLADLMPSALAERWQFIIRK